MTEPIPAVPDLGPMPDQLRAWLEQLYLRERLAGIANHAITLEYTGFLKAAEVFKARAFQIDPRPNFPEMPFRWDKRMKIEEIHQCQKILEEETDPRRLAELSTIMQQRGMHDASNTFAARSLLLNAVLYAGPSQ
jgi:hypothetical protein